MVRTLSLDLVGPQVVFRTYGVGVGALGGFATLWGGGLE
jgi:hypothetical protein